MSRTAHDAPIEFGRHMEAVARHVWGEPNPRLSTTAELRWGNHGARVVDLKKGTWFDHHDEKGGGVLDLLRREAGMSNGEALDFLRDEIGAEVAEPGKRKIVATYDYHDETGELLFQVVRYEPKDFRQRRPDGKGGWSWSTRGVRRVPYRLAELEEAIATERTVFVVEGEKDVEALARHNVPATCNPGGAGKWSPSFAEFFAGADVVILPDNDDAGRKHADAVGASLVGKVASLRMLELPDLPPKGDVSDWLAAGGSAETLFDLVERRARPWAAAPFESRFGAVWFDDIGRGPARHDWIVKGLLGRGDLSCFYGPPKSGKSFLALDLSLTIAAAALLPPRSVSWFGRKVVGAGVVYVAAEGQRGMIVRIAAWRERAPVELRPGIPFVLLPSSVDLRSENSDTEALIAEINAHAARMPVPLGLTVIDTVARAMAGGNENGPEDMGAFIRNCGLIQKGTGSHVLGVHHTGKDETRGMRGHNSLRAAIDTGVEIAKDDDDGQNTWTVREQKEGEEGATLAFHLESVSVGTDDDGDAITSCVVKASPSEEGPRDKARSKRQAPLPDQARIALRVLQDVMIDYGEIPPASRHIPPGVRVVQERVWRDTCFRGGLTAADASGEAKQKAFSRARDLLRARGFIASWDAFVWLTGRGD